MTVILIATLPAGALNMEEIGRHRPDFFVHSLDVELHGDLALVTGYGGLMIYDISDGVRYLNRYLTGGGRNSAFYNCKAAGNVALVTARASGLYIVDIESPDNPSLITRWSPQNQSLEDCVYRDEVLAVSAHQFGVYFLDVSDPRSPQPITACEGLVNAWGVVFDTGGNLLVADGEGGIAVVSFNGDEARILSRAATSGQAIDIKVSGDLCAVAVGADGVDLFDVAEPAEPVFITNFDTPTYAGHIGLDDSLVAVADWNEVLVFDVSDREHPVLDGRRSTEARAMGVDIRGTNVYLADWAPFIGYSYGRIEGPDIRFSTRRINPLGSELIDTSLHVFNDGHSLLEVRSITSNAPRFEVDPDAFSLEPGDTMLVEFAYLPDEGDRAYNMVVNSNDGDEPRLAVKLEGAGGISEGEAAPDFAAPLLDGGQYRLSDMRGRVQLLIFWTSW